MSDQAASAHPPHGFLPMVEMLPSDAMERTEDFGQRVEMVTRKLREHGEEGMIVYGYKFRPVANGN